MANLTIREQAPLARLCGLARVARDDRITWAEVDRLGRQLVEAVWEFQEVNWAYIHDQFLGR